MRRFSLFLMLGYSAAVVDCDGLKSQSTAAFFDLSIVPVLADDSADPSLMSSVGWKVKLEEACLAFGPIYLYHDAEQHEAACRPSPLHWLKAGWSWLLPSVYAHGAYDGDGEMSEVCGEWTKRVALNVLSNQMLLFQTLSGRTESVTSFSVVLGPVRSKEASVCHQGEYAYARGVASKDGKEILFEGGLFHQDGEEEPRAHRLPVRDVSIEDGGEIQLLVDSTQWFDEVDFAGLTVYNDDGRRRILPRSEAAVLWRRKLESDQSFRIVQVLNKKR
ncbi:hypothetical protein [Pajaroellobacter abortibovis]|nr:hypothetical protein [Pajaroellobacter abortibovis]